MISSLRGTLLAKSPTDIVVDVNGVGYALLIPLSTYEALGPARGPVELLTYLHVRDDALVLYGFATEEEREMFRLLISVNGIGPRMGQTILSGMSVAELRTCITGGNLSALTGIPGVGRKIAERLVVELREKIGRGETQGLIPGGAGDPHSRARGEALLALTSLGYSRPVAERALRAALQEQSGNDASIEVLVKSALRHASGQRP